MSEFILSAYKFATESVNSYTGLQIVLSIIELFIPGLWIDLNRKLITELHSFAERESEPNL
jgi:hypothetical protein